MSTGCRRRQGNARLGTHDSGAVGGSPSMRITVPVVIQAGDGLTDAAV